MVKYADMIGGLATPTRDGNDHHRGVLTDASSRMNRQRTNSFNAKPQYQYLSPESFTTPDCKGFNIDYYLETSGKSSQSPHRRLRRDTSTRTLRSLARHQRTRGNCNQYDTVPYTPSKLSKVMIAEYELDISDIDTPLTTMPTRLSLNKKLPPKPIFRLENSPERRGLLDATDLSSSALQFPILQPNPVVSKSAIEESSLTDSVTTVSHTQDSAFVVTSSFAYNSDTDSVFEVGTAQIGTAYGASTNIQLPTPPEDKNMVVPRVRETNATKLANTSGTDAAKNHILEVPSGNDCLASPSHIASMKDNGSPLPKNQRFSRSSLINDESSYPKVVDNVISRFSTHQQTPLSTNIENNDEPSVRSIIDVGSNDGLNDLLTRIIVDGSDGVTGIVAQDIPNDGLTEEITDNTLEVTDQGDFAQSTANITNQEQIIQVATNTALQAIAHCGPIGRSESQTTIGRKREMSLVPSTRFARNADRIVLGTSPPYSKVSTRLYIDEFPEDIEQSNTVLEKIARKKTPVVKPKGISAATSKFGKRKSSLPDSAENKTLKPTELTLEKKQSLTDRLSKPTASSAARANANAKSRKSEPASKSSAMSSVKNAGRGLKSRLSGMMRNRRTSEVVVMDPPIAASISAPEEAFTQHDIPTVIVEKAPEISPFVNDRDVGEEFASFYSEITYFTERVNQVGSGEHATNNSAGRSRLVSSQVVETSVEAADSTAQMADYPTSVAKHSVMSTAQVDAIFREQDASPSDSVIEHRIQTLSLGAPKRSPPSVTNSYVQVQGNGQNDVQVTAGNGASDPPPRENGNDGHAHEQPLPPSVEESLTEIKNTLDSLRHALTVEPDPAQQIVLAGCAVFLTHKVQAINNNRKLRLLLQKAQDVMVLDASVEALAAKRTLRQLGHRVDAAIINHN
ncbi:uncharacterized protein EAE97_001286 [Botrytis byssoidea]|uniref:Uncharacterized protein n=1 Tax=Botrytis byssoidea TaxID=139641 RepID=A0A9P5M692_9HELO|nr:uncharacterized protein EAE97_001286 [Botrytis byssoidea]KAF7953887.1 hypothetical protein EAE97_001286 [Botrytis byssoidea]